MGSGIKKALKMDVRRVWIVQRYDVGRKALRLSFLRFQHAIGMPNTLRISEITGEGQQICHTIIAFEELWADSAHFLLGLVKRPYIAPIEFLKRIDTETPNRMFRRAKRALCLT